MKKTVLLMAAALTAFGAIAQNRVLNNPDNKAYFGARLSIDSSIPGDIKSGNVSVDALDHGAGLSLGMVYNIPIVANLYVEPGIDLYYNTQSIKLDELVAEGSPAIDFSHRSLRKFGMRVPVQIGYHFDFSRSFNISVYTGPVLDVGFSNDYYLTTKKVNGTDYHASGSVYKDNGLNRVDCAWRIGIGTTFLKNYYVGLSGDIGMCNMIKNNHDGAVKMRNNAFHLTLGYNF